MWPITNIKTELWKSPQRKQDLYCKTMLENAHRAAHFFAHSAALFFLLQTIFLNPLCRSIFSSPFFWPTLPLSNQITTHLIMHSANTDPLFLVYLILYLHNNFQISILTTQYFSYTIRYLEFFFQASTLQLKTLRLMLTQC